jgi:hypothetical protein
MAGFQEFFGITMAFTAFAAAAMGANALWRVYKNRDQYEQEANWEKRLHQLASQLVAVGPRQAMNETGQDSSIPLYETIFPDLRFRALLEQHVIEIDRKRTRFTPRYPRPAQLRDPILRTTVETAESLIRDFRQSHPEFAQLVGSDSSSV